MKCKNCNSTSIILDGLYWVCAEHITPCRCSSHGDNFDLFEKIHDGFNFQGTWPRIPITTRDNERQLSSTIENEEEDAD